MKKQDKEFEKALAEAFYNMAMVRKNMTEKERTQEKIRNSIRARYELEGIAEEQRISWNRFRNERY